MSNKVLASATAEENNAVVPLMIADPSESRSPNDRLEVVEDTECGYGFLRGKALQRLATKNVYASFYGLLGCVLFSAYSYSMGTITTLEKRFKIPSKTIGE